MGMDISMHPILSVTEVSLSLKATVEQVFGYVRVRGEVSGLKKASSGHIYFSLKDADSVLSAVCWRGRDRTTVSALEEGLEVICTGKLSTYPGRSNYQMIVDSAEPAGLGALLALLKERQDKLQKEGLFDTAHKQPIPYLPQTIGVITSPSGAVIRDIMHRLSERFGRHVVLWPVLVQGEGAADQIRTAIQGFNAIPHKGLETPQGVIPRPDVLIVARGGGSFEDLWCFNDEGVVRATYASQIPIISAVGHETDTTLIDYAADLRAPTPTGAAEKAVPVRSELVNTLLQRHQRLNSGIQRTFAEQELALNLLIRSLPNLSDVIHLFFQKLDDQSDRLVRLMHFYHTTLTQRWKNLAQLLHSYSYTSILERGFAFITSSQGKIIDTTGKALAQNRLKITLKDGFFEATPLKNKDKINSFFSHQNPSSSSVSPSSQHPQEDQKGLFDDF